MFKLFLKYILNKKKELLKLLDLIFLKRFDLGIVGHYNVGKEPIRRPSRSISIFWSMAMDYHHEHQLSTGHFLSLPFDSLSLRDMETLL